MKHFIIYLFIVFLNISPIAKLYGSSFETPKDASAGIQTIQESEKLLPSKVTANEPNGEFALRDALSLTLIHNPQLQAYSLEIRAAEARELQAGLWPNPELDIEVEDFGGTGERSGFDSAQTTIQLGQLIELGNKSGKRKQVASIEKELASLDYQSKRLEVFGETTKAFIFVLEAQQRIQLSENLLNLSRESLGAVEKRVEAGKDSPLEITRAKVAVSNIEIQLQKARRDLTFARQRLSSFWGQQDPLFQRAAGELEQIEAPASQQQLVEMVKINPEFARWETELKKNAAILEMEKSKSFPDVTIGGGVRRFNDRNDNAFVFNIVMPLPISNRNQGARQEALINISKARANQKAAWQKIYNELNDSYREFVNSYSKANSLKEQVLPAATEAFAAATRAYEEGKSGYLNVLDSQRTLFELKNEYVQSLAAYHLARTDIERLAGQEIMQKQINNEGGKE